MKKKTIVLLLILSILVLAAASVSLWYVMQTVPSDTSRPAKLLPDDTLAMVRLFDLQKRIKTFRTSRLGRKLAQIDIEKIMREFQVSEAAKKNINRIKTTASNTADSMLFNELFGQDTAVAVLPAAMNQLPSRAYDLRGIVLISRTKHPRALVEFASKLLSVKPEYEKRNYSGYDITFFKPEEEITVYYTLANNLLLAAFDFDTLKCCLDLKIKTQKTLEDYAPYQAVIKQLISSKNQVLAYINPSLIYKQMEKTLQNTNQNKNLAPKHIDMLKQLDSLQGFQAVGYGDEDDGGKVLRAKLVAKIDTAKMSPLYAATYKFRPKENRTLMLKPSDLILYVATNSIDMGQLLAFFVNQGHENDKVAQTLKTTFKTQTGVDLDVFAKAVGHQYGIMLTNIDTRGLFPIINLVLAAETRNKEVIDNLLLSVIQRSNLNPGTERYKDTEISYLKIPLGNTFEPAYAFIDDFCVMATNRHLLKKVIDGQTPGSYLEDSSDFKVFGKAFIGKNNQIAFIKVDLLLDGLKDMLEWFGGMMTLKDEHSAKKFRILLDQGVLPLMDAVKIYKTVGVNTLYDDQQITMNSFVLTQP
jgi:hypothetical protein